MIAINLNNTLKIYLFKVKVIASYVSIIFDVDFYLYIQYYIEKNIFAFFIYIPI